MNAVILLGRFKIMIKSFMSASYCDMLKQDLDMFLRMQNL